MKAVQQAAPIAYAMIDQATREHGFTMASDPDTCSLLRTLAAIKPCGRFLELGTGTGLSTSWILDGMDAGSQLITVDNDAVVLEIAKAHLGQDARVEWIEMDGEAWILQSRNEKFDFIFADTWHGKYFFLDEVLDMLKPGGLYVIDDMLPQPNWPEGHDKKVALLLEDLRQRRYLVTTILPWASGLVVAVRH
jgi:predicted O-methyltransferase YrrM